MQPPRFEARGHLDQAARYYSASALVREELRLIQARHAAADGDAIEEQRTFPVKNQMSTVKTRVANEASWRVEVRPHEGKAHTVYTPSDDGHVQIHTYHNDRVVSRRQTAPDNAGSDHLQNLHVILFDFGEANAEEA